jgi:hypothetical protein
LYGCAVVDVMPVHETVADALPADAETPVTVCGTSTAVMLFDVEEKSDETPELFVILILKE